MGVLLLGASPISEARIEGARGDVTRSSHPRQRSTHRGALRRTRTTAARHAVVFRLGQGLTALCLRVGQVQPHLDVQPIGGDADPVTGAPDHLADVMDRMVSVFEDEQLAPPVLQKIRLLARDTLETIAEGPTRETSPKGSRSRTRPSRCRRCSG
jgi:hypothetical protein